MFDPCVEPMGRNLTVGTDKIEMPSGADYDIHKQFDAGHRRRIGISIALGVN